MTDRDTFAAAALTGFATQLRYGSVFNLTLTAHQCYELADAMLRERERNGAVSSRETVPVTEHMPKQKRTEVYSTTHDAVPAAIVSTPDEHLLHAASELGNPGEASRQGDFTGNTQEPVAWAQFFSNGGPQSVYLDRPPADAEPLYRSPALTDAEREAIGEAIRLGDQWGWSETLRGLLERTK